MEKREPATEYLEKVELADVMDMYPKELSGGMRQRITITRSLSVKLQILLADGAISKKQK